MSEQSELKQLYEVRDKLDAIKALNDTILKKQKYLESEQDRAENTSVKKPNIDHEEDELENIRLHNRAKNRKTYIALVAITICVYIALAVVTMYMAYNYYVPALENLSEGEFLSLGVQGVGYGASKDDLLVGMFLYGLSGFTGLCTLTVYILHKHYDRKN